MAQPCTYDALYAFPPKFDALPRIDFFIGPAFSESAARKVPFRRRRREREREREEKRDGWRYIERLTSERTIFFLFLSSRYAFIGGAGAKN